MSIVVSPGGSRNRFSTVVRCSKLGASPLSRPEYASSRSCGKVVASELPLLLRGSRTASCVNQPCRGKVPINATRTPRPASAAAKLAATESCASPSGDVTTIDRGSRSVARLVAASARYAASRWVPGLATSSRRPRGAAGIEESSGAAKAAVAVFVSRMVWSRRSTRIGTASASRRPTTTMRSVGVLEGEAGGVTFATGGTSTTVA